MTFQVEVHMMNREILHVDPVEEPGFIYEILGDQHGGKLRLPAGNMSAVYLIPVDKVSHVLLTEIPE